mgnify:FL=1
MEALFGSELQGKSESVPSAQLNEVKFVLVYFSAHWCPPCRGFTPKLAMFYESVNATEKQLEIVYVSLDKTEEQFEEYYSEMPWLALPFSETSRRNTLSARFGVQGIPALFLIDKEGNVKKDNCRNDVNSKGPLCLGEWESALNSL